MRGVIAPRVGGLKMAEDVRAVFVRIVSDVGADHLRASDADLIEQYAAAICLAREAYQNIQDEGQ